MYGTSQESSRYQRGGDDLGRWRVTLPVLPPFLGSKLTDSARFSESLSERYLINIASDSSCDAITSVGNPTRFEIHSSASYLSASSGTSFRYFHLIPAIPKAPVGKETKVSITRCRHPAWAPRGLDRIDRRTGCQKSFKKNT